MFSVVRRGSFGPLSGFSQRAVVQTQALEHAQHQRPGALHPDAALAQRPPEHRQDPGSQEREEGPEETPPRRGPLGPRQPPRAGRLRGGLQL